MPKVIQLVNSRVSIQSMCPHLGFLTNTLLCLSSSIQMPNLYSVNYLLCLDLLLIGFYSFDEAICFFLGISLVPIFTIWDFSAPAL